ncbi:rhomboid family intramembrane serine protease [Arthrobacter agilis]|uniref:rhomboid family intramembrane serine protease n=1 Tax=Arthrobacter agilis TaxID=37921 RepID=UPI000B35429B|nr:rhomboid family intramembrane serine protease [Arthrobacter agilis]OUM42312.1 rhomboid family intramembrane serine protease [Arthrobacter agilis]PPB45655.1 rhomboid family intramembrane serine protease [Arthrobacter agilis]TPV26363.1 rhomboid family intramembrane serine protease [Arthrobacter agilis]VDR30768.1 Rhomboid protease gluP [Arthrobacter agilis]
MSFGVPAPDAGSQQAPVCPRHPDRVSYVRCQRCGRPACAECQRTAAVGFQCVDCVREQAANAPVQRTAFGGVARGGSPVVTYTLIGICAVVFLLQLVVPGLTRAFSYAPVYTAGAGGIIPAEPWRMVTAAFLHSPSSFLHIAFNMYALYILGKVLEPAMGRARFLALYLVSAVGGSVGVLLLSNFQQSVVGASGAVFGLFGALFIIQRKRGGDVRQIVVLVGINAVLGFVVPGIAWQAHLGGLLTGAACAAVIAYAPRGARQTQLQWAGLAGVVVLLGLLTFVGVSLLPV